MLRSIRGDFRCNTLALLGLSTIAAFAIPASASAAVSCTLTGSTLEVTVVGSGAQQAGVRMDSVPDPDQIEVFDSIGLSTEQACTGAPATAANTEAITIDDPGGPADQSTRVKVSLAGGPFLNSTAEGGGDPEIEITFDSGPGGDDRLTLEPGPGATADNFRMGELTVFPDSNFEGINLNGLETGVIDGDDVRMINTEELRVAPDGNPGNDVIDARGGPEPEFMGPMDVEDLKELFGGSGDDQLFGGGDGWLLDGGSGADTIVGGADDDVMRVSSGTESDAMDGNGGADTCSWLGHPAGVRVDLTDPSPQNTIGAGIATIADCENLEGGNGDDTLLGGPGPNTLSGSGGADRLRPGPGSAADTLNGGSGVDTADYSDSPVGVTLNLNNSIQNTGGAGTDVFAVSVFIGITPTIENLIGTPASDMLTGSSAPNHVIGGEGADTIALQGADDTFDSYDAFPDAVDCGTGNDSGFASEAGVDTLTNCEASDFAPNTTVVSGPADGSTTDSQTPTYDLTASEGGVAFQVSVDNGGFATCGAGCQVPGLTEGQHSLRFRAVESAGAQRPDPTPAQRTVTIDAVPADPTPPDPSPPGITPPDTTPPDTAIRKPKLKRDAAKLRFTSTEQGSTFTCKFDRKKPRPCTSPTTYRNLDKGKHKVKVTATDAAGNADPSPATAKFKIDEERIRSSLVIRPRLVSL